MSIYEREKEYMAILSEREHTVSELSKILFISEPTVRRDILLMKKKEIVECRRGVVSLKTYSADKQIPLFVRQFKHNDEKHRIAERAAALVKDGMVIMLDASTTAAAIVPYLSRFTKLFVITSGARTAMALASLGIRTVCTGGEMVLDSLSYVGGDAMRTLSGYTADIAFFSCSALTEDGLATDNSIAENDIRKIMIKRAARSYLLCDSNKIGKRDLNILCDAKDISGVITDLDDYEV